MIPFIQVIAESIPEAWETAVYKCYKEGIVIESEWGKCREVTLHALITNPLKEPRVHIAGILSFKSLFEYVEEVLKGTADWRIGKDWHYTYHERLFRYKVYTVDEHASNADIIAKYPLVRDSQINQIEYIIEKLKKVPGSRRAVAVTWQPWRDEWVDSPPCLNWLQMRVIEGKLHAWFLMRSNDALKASFYNMFAFSELMRYVADRLGVKVGPMHYIASSYHIYEKSWDLKQAEKLAKLIESGRSRVKWITTEKAMEFARLKG